MESFTTQSPRQAVSNPTYGATDNREGQNQSFSLRPSEFLDGLGVWWAFVLAPKRALVQHLDSEHHSIISCTISRILTWLGGHDHYSELAHADHGSVWAGSRVVKALKVLITAILGSNPTTRRFSLKSRLFSLSFFAHFWVDLGLLKVRTLFQKSQRQFATYGVWREMVNDERSHVWPCDSA